MWICPNPVFVRSRVETRSISSSFHWSARVVSSPTVGSFIKANSFFEGYVLRQYRRKQNFKYPPRTPGLPRRTKRNSGVFGDHSTDGYVREEQTQQGYTTVIFLMIRFDGKKPAETVPPFRVLVYYPLQIVLFVIMNSPFLDVDRFLDPAYRHTRLDSLRFSSTVTPTCHGRPIRIYY